MTLPWLKTDAKTEQTVLSELHGKISPVDVRLGEPIRITLSAKVRDSIVTKTMRAWRVSPLGIEVIQDDAFRDLKVGDKVEIELCIGMSVSKLVSIVAVTDYNERGFNILGLRLYSKEDGNWGGEERRSSNRWLTSREFMPTGVAANPGKFNDFLYFKVSDISSTGLKIITSLRNKFIFPGMRLESTISMPMIGLARADLEVINAKLISEDGKEALAVGCRLVRPSRQLLKALGEYVFQFGPPVSLKELKESGLWADKFAAGVEFRYVRTKEEYEQVIELRKLAYSSAGKLTSSEDVTDVYDARSRIIIGVYKGKVVASTRLIFNEVSDQMEHEQFVSMPDHLPRKDEICEITRVCTHPDYRGSDLLLSLFRFVGITVVQSGRKYILGCATKELLPLYLKLGFERTGLIYKHAALNNIEHEIFIGNVVAGLTGKGVNPLVWNVVWSSVANYLNDNSIVEYDHVAKIRIGIFKMFKPLASLMVYFSKRPRKK